MAKAAVKKTVRRKKRERKNVEKGQAHIQSTFNNTLVQDLLDSKVQENQLHLLHKALLKKRQKVLWNTDLKRLRFM